MNADLLYVVKKPSQSSDKEAHLEYVIKLF